MKIILSARFVCSNVGFCPLLSDQNSVPNPNVCSEIEIVLLSSHYKHFSLGMVDGATDEVRKEWFRKDGGLNWPEKAQNQKSMARVRDAITLEEYTFYFSSLVIIAIHKKKQQESSTIC